MSTIHTQSFLHGEAQFSKSVNQTTKGKFDLAIFVSSWDKRCLCVTEGNDFHSKHGILVLFNTRDSHGLRDRHDPKLEKYVKNHCDYSQTVTGYSVDVDGTWEKLITAIKSIKENVGQTLKIFLDLSTCTRFYALAILGTCFKEGIAKSLTAFYAEGLYKETLSVNEDSFDEYTFTKGQWKTVAIPSFEGIYHPGKKKYYLLSVGFEGTKTMQVLTREDPDRISILFPDPGIIPDYKDQAQKSNKNLMQKYKVPDDQIIKEHAGDAIAVWKRLSSLSLERPLIENVYYFCCGTKPHAIGLGLRAICEKYPLVLYRIPAKHAVMDIDPYGVYWQYKIEDLSALP